MKNKLRIWLGLLLCLLTTVLPGFAQSPIPVIDTLDIEIWPDYDKPSVLVLLTGRLPGDVRLPTTVTLPLPEAAQLNAVARIDGQDGNMKDDIFFNIDESGLTFNTPDFGFRVEYYLPYATAANRRSFDYTWLSATDVDNLQIRVQQPASASLLNTDPPSANVFRSRDGFEYHVFPTRAVPAGQSFSLQVDYVMATDSLSATSLAPVKSSPQSRAIPAAPQTGYPINWALAAVIAGGLLIVMAAVWQMASRRSAADAGGSVDERVEKPSRAKFCRNCGEPVDEGDRFCSGCGSEL